MGLAISINTAMAAGLPIGPFFKENVNSGMIAAWKRTCGNAFASLRCYLQPSLMAVWLTISLKKSIEDKENTTPVTLRITERLERKQRAERRAKHKPVVQLEAACNRVTYLLLPQVAQIKQHIKGMPEM
jgi:hypothetical protein